MRAGKYWIGSESADDLTGALSRTQLAGGPQGEQNFGLTQRELDIVTAVLAAYSNKEIAERFSLSEKTVKRHLTNIFDKLGVSNRLELAMFAFRHSDLELPELPAARPPS